MKIKKVFIYLLLLCMTASMFAVESSAADAPESSTGNAMIAYCIDDTQFLYAQRGDESVAPTVATKLMAAMVIYDIFTENGKSLEDTPVSITADSLQSIGAVGDISAPMLGLSAGSTYYASDLMSATLVACANDACSALSYYAADTFLYGGITEFIERMNEKAESLGLTKTNFVNVTGLDNIMQTSTPKEVALISAAFYKYDYLVKLSDVESFKFNGRTVIRNKNYLLSNFFVNGFLNKSAIGLIAGQRSAKGDYCVITASEIDGRSYVFVVMCASGMIVDAEGNRSFDSNNAYDDINKLIAWTKTSFEYMLVADTGDTVDEIRVNLGRDSDYVLVVPAEKVERLVLINADESSIQKIIKYNDTVYQSDFEGASVNTVDAPITQGQVLGTVTYTYNGLELATVELVAKSSIEAGELLTALDGIKSFLMGETMKTIIIILISIVVLWILVSIASAILRAVKSAKGSGSGSGAKRQGKKRPAEQKHDSNTDTKPMGK